MTGYLYRGAKPASPPSPDLEELNAQILAGRTPEQQDRKPRRRPSLPGRQQASRRELAGDWPWVLPPAAWDRLQRRGPGCRCHDVTVFGHQTWCPLWQSVNHEHGNTNLTPAGN